MIHFSTHVVILSKETSSFLLYNQRKQNSFCTPLVVFELVSLFGFCYSFIEIIIIYVFSILYCTLLKAQFEQLFYTYYNLIRQQVFMFLKTEKRKFST